MSEITVFEERLSTVKARMEQACMIAGRDLAHVQLLAVSKTKPPEAVEIAAQCGLRFFGENKVCRHVQMICSGI